MPHETNTLSLEERIEPRPHSQQCGFYLSWETCLGISGLKFLTHSVQGGSGSMTPSASCAPLIGHEKFFFRRQVNFPSTDGSESKKFSNRIGI